MSSNIGRLEEIGLKQQQLSHLAFPSVDGSLVKISDYQGKRLLIFVWASW